MKKLLVVGLIGVIYGLLRSPVIDERNMCDVRCQWEHGFENPEITGYINLMNTSQCDCYNKIIKKGKFNINYQYINSIPRKYEKNQWFWHYNDDTICGNDGKTYQSPVIFSKQNTDTNNNNNPQILQCGPCGKCSNMHDITKYHETKHTLTTISLYCALLGNMLPVIGNSAAFYCFV